MNEVIVEQLETALVQCIETLKPVGAVFYPYIPLQYGESASPENMFDEVCDLRGKAPVDGPFAGFTGNVVIFDRENFNLEDVPEGWTHSYADDILSKDEK